VRVKQHYFPPGRFWGQSADSKKGIADKILRVRGIGCAGSKDICLFKGFLAFVLHCKKPLDVD
jgi:hypothetical protein